MKKYPQKMKIVRFLILALLSLGFVGSAVLGCGGGSASPPASIPAPVSSLMSTTTPGQDGATLITGAAGSVNGGATVQAANVTQGGTFSLWEILFIRSAYAQIFSGSTIANDQGAFNLTIDTSVGDRVQVRQVVGGEASSVTEITIPCSPCG